MALAMTVTKHWADFRTIHVIGTLTASGNYVSDGDTIPANPAIKSTKAPLYASFNFLAKYMGRLNDGKLKIFLPDTGAELGAGAYPAAITGDTITFYAIYPKLR